MTPIRRTYTYRLINGSPRLRVRWCNIECYRSTGLNVDPDKWDGTRCRPNSIHGKKMVPAALINKRLQQLEMKFDAVFMTFELKDVVPDKDELMRALDPERKKQDFNFERSFNTFVIEESRRRMWADNTIRSVRQVGEFVRLMAPKLKLSDITPSWLDKYVTYQQHHRMAKGRSSTLDDDTSGGYSNAVILKNCRVFRWFLKWAADQNLIDSRTVNDWRPVIKKIDRPVIWLEMGELARLMGLELAAGSLLDRARDIFCLQCFTGLRYSDVMALLKSSVKSGHIEVTTIKTGTVLRIELNRHSRAILNKYSRTPGEKAMPQLDSSTLNKYIKAVASMAGINDPVTITQYYGSERRSVTRPKHEFLSSHAGRRTFICNALALGISPVVVMKWTGHTEYASMKPYIDVADSTKSRAMTLFDAIDSDY